MRGALSPQEAAESPAAQQKRKNMLAFYRQRSESLKGANTTARRGALAAPSEAEAKPAAAPAKRRPGLLGYIADAYDSAVR